MNKKDQREAVIKKIKEYEKHYTLFMLIREDSKSYKGFRHSFFCPGFWLVFHYRIAHFLYKKHLDFLAKLIQIFIYFLFSCEISRKAHIGPGLAIFHPMGIFIGPLVYMGKCCTVGPNTFVGANKNTYNPEDYPIIDDFVVFAAGSQVYGGIVVGARVRIGPGAIVFRDVPDKYNVIAPTPRYIERSRWHR